MEPMVGFGKLKLGVPLFIRVVSWVYIVFSMGMTVGASLAGNWEFGIVFTLCLLLGVFLLIVVGSLEMDREFVTYKSIWATYRIRWDEIEFIEMDEPGLGVIFEGHGKRLAVGALNYQPPQKLIELQAFLQTKRNDRHLEFRVSRSLSMKASKNTKIG